MKTVKQVSELTGISVRTLHYYDEIGLFKPSRVTDAGYRLYDEDALQTLQQILFFRELDFPLKDIQTIMLDDPDYDRKKAFAAQRKLILAKRDRLNRLLDLLDKLIKGETCMSFEEFHMNEYTDALEAFIKNNQDEIRKHGGDLDEFGRVLETLKTDGPQKAEIEKMIVRQYGSVEKFTESMKERFEKFPEIMEQANALQGEVNGAVDRSKALMGRLTADLSRDPSSEEVQKIVGELVTAGSAYTEAFQLDKNYWGMMVDYYLTNPAIAEATDKVYGPGAAAFIGNALKVYWKL